MQIMFVLTDDHYYHARDHIDTIRRLGVDAHLVTHLPEQYCDPRFATVTRIEKGTDPEEAARIAISAARKFGVRGAITIREYDVWLVAQINEALGVPTAPPESIRIGRNKGLQRRLAAEFGLPIPGFSELSKASDIKEIASRLAFPLIVKPTFTNGSKLVRLCRNVDEVRDHFERIRGITPSRVMPPAVVEEYLPGTEVTMDGIVIDGTYILGGIFNKKRMDGPFFMEDLYSLPFRTPDREPELCAIAQKLVSALALNRSQIEIEFRQDKDGRFRIVEFQLRLGSGHCYRNVRDVYWIDLLKLHIESLLEPHRPIGEFDTRRLPPRMATCVKFIYRSGKVLRNNVGNAQHSYHLSQYNARSLPGDVVALPPDGFDSIGGLSIWSRYNEPSDIDRAEEIALALERELDIVMEDSTDASPQPGRQ